MAQQHVSGAPSVREHWPLDDDKTAAMRADDAAVHHSMAAAIARMAHFNAESQRLLPALSTTVGAHVKTLTDLRADIARLEARAAACRARALALAEKRGVDVAGLSLHDPDAVEA